MSLTHKHCHDKAATLNGVRDRILADIMGHSTTKMVQRYQHIDSALLMKEIEKATAHHRLPGPPAEPSPATPVQPALHRPEAPDPSRSDAA